MKIFVQSYLPCNQEFFIKHTICLVFLSKKIEVKINRSKKSFEYGCVLPLTSEILTLLVVLRTTFPSTL